MTCGRDADDVKTVWRVALVDERQRKLADAIGEAARAALLKTATSSGTHVAREASGQS